MCQLLDEFYAQCSHWGHQKAVETRCPAGELPGMKSGCHNSEVVGSKRIEGLCPICRYRGSLFTAQAPTQPKLTFTKIMQEQRTQNAEVSKAEIAHEARKKVRIIQRTCDSKKSVRPLTRKGIEEKPLTFAVLEELEKEKKQQNAIVHIPIG
jgi:hypothetical protein